MIVACATSALALTALLGAYRSVKGLTADDGVEVVLGILRLRPKGMEALLASHSSGAAALALSVLNAPTAESARAEVREVLFEIAHQKYLKAIPLAAGRAGLTLGTLGAVVEIAQGLPVLVGPTLWASVAFGTGLLAWFGSTYIGKRADQFVRRRFEAWTALGRILEALASGRGPGVRSTPLAGEQEKAQA